MAFCLTWNLEIFIFLPLIWFEVLLTSTQLDCCILPTGVFQAVLLSQVMKLFYFFFCFCWISAVICVLYVLVGMYICLETLYWVFVFLPNLMWIMGKCCVLPCCLLQQILGTYIQIYSRERQTDRQIMDQLFWKS